MARQSIANRWFLRSFSAIVVILIFVDIALFYMIQYYFYNSVMQTLRAETNVVSTVLLRFYNDSTSNYATEIRNTVEEFDKKEHMELMAIDQNGRVVLTSSGFSPDIGYQMPDYETAKTSTDGVGMFVGEMKSNEKCMAVTSLLNIQDSDSTYSAVRLVVSLEQVDVQVGALMLFVLLISAAIILIMLVLGLYFVKSIVVPLRQVAITAKRVAEGDFTTKIPVRTDDELGQLCRVFNYMAEELANSESIKNDFISSVSHELRTPLTAIKGWSETISYGMEDKETVKKGMRVIASESERLSGMVEELLDFSRIQNGKFSMQKANMDIVAELTDALIIYDDKAKKENITITYREPDEIATIFGDRNRIRQVFINIIDNAIKYTPKDGQIDIDVRITDADIYISVQDSGCGISSEDLPKIKNKFYKANHTKRGSGIGLAVANEIVEMHGGTLEIRSVLGQGATVNITIPLLLKSEIKTEQIEQKE